MCVNILKQGWHCKRRLLYYNNRERLSSGLTKEREKSLSSSLSLDMCEKRFTSTRGIFMVINKKVLSVSSIASALFLFHYISTQSTAVKKEVKAYYASKTSNELITEPVDRLVKIIYSNNPLSRLLLPVSGYVGKYATRYAGKVANSTDQATVQAKINRFQTLYKDMLNMHEYVVPKNGFNTFNDWFIRTFKDIDKSRPLSSDPLAIV